MSDDLQSYFERQFTELEEMLSEQGEVQEREAILEREIARRTQKIAQIALTCSDDLSPTSRAARLARGLQEGGLSNAIRNVFKAAKEPLGAVDIHRELKAIGYPLEAYQNVLATLHLTLKRLQGQGEIDPTIVEGKKGFVWSGRPARPKWTQFLPEMAANYKPVDVTDKKIISGKLSDLVRPQNPRGLGSLGKKKD